MFHNFFMACLGMKVGTKNVSWYAHCTCSMQYHKHAVSFGDFLRNVSDQEFSIVLTSRK